MVDRVALKGEANSWISARVRPHGRCKIVSLLACAALLTGCVQTQWQGSGYQQSQTLLSPNQTMDLEVTDRIARFERLSRLQGVIPPRITEVTLPAQDVPGASRPIPVIRVTFEERGFFAPGSASPTPEAQQALQVIAENMRRDVPDVRVTVLGHTDSTGTATGNEALSQARATEVVQSLVGDGVNPGQLSAVAIGSAQPIAPNATANGRALNRRVEFLISPSEQANLATVSLRPVNPAFLAASGPPVRSARRSVAILKPTYSGPADFAEAPMARRSGTISLAAAGPLPIGDNATGSPVMTDMPTSSGVVPAAADSGSPVGAATANYP